MDQTAAIANAGQKPRRGFAGLWNIGFGVCGIQIGLAWQTRRVEAVL